MKKIIIIVLIILVLAPWMTSNWCKKRLYNREFDSLGPINESWEVSTTWIPFGRWVKVQKPESEWPKSSPPGPPLPGGYGFNIFMIFTGNTFFFTGR